MKVLAPVAATARTPLARSTAALVVNTLINGALGLVYWVLAARLYDPAVVGLGAGGVSSLLFVAGLGWMGVQQVLLRYLPAAGSERLPLISAVYGIAVTLALVVGVGFLIAVGSRGSLEMLFEEPWMGPAFLAAVILWVIFSLQDPVLIGIGRSELVPLENLAFGLTKLSLLVAFAGFGQPWAIVGSWALGASWLVVVVSMLLRRERGARLSAALPPAGKLVRFGLGQHVLAVVQSAPDWLVPLMVLSVVGPEGTAFYYAAWTVSFSVRLLAVNLGTAATAEGGRRGADQRRARRQVRVIATAVILPAVLTAWLLAEFILAIYGPRYAAAIDLLRLLVAAVVPFTIVTLFVVAERIAERTMVALAIMLAVTGLTLALDVVLLPRIGISGAGWGWLIAQIAGVGLVVAVLWLRARRMGGETISPIA